MLTVRLCTALILTLSAMACARGDSPPAAGRDAPQRPWILLVTLDTTRADAIGPGARADTPAFNAVAARGRRFLQAYATAPETLPSHASMLTGLYPAGHGVHENARFVPAAHPLAAERLRDGGYTTAAFVSSFVLARRFGLARGFEVYDDDLPAGAAERSSAETTDRALAYLRDARQPQFVWVHYFDPHTPYAPPARFRDRYRDAPYLGEVAAMDEQLGRLVAAFDDAARRAGAEPAVIIAADHGEGLGDHGELQHGNLLYQSTMHVPLVIAGPGVAPGTSDTPVSVRRIFHTLLDWGGVDATDSLRGNPREVVLGEAMKPYLSYGWQPQIMAVEGTLKAILAGRVEAYDLAADSHETRDLGSGARLPQALRRALDDYPVPSLEGTHASDTLSDEARRSLASLGYVSGGATPVVRRDAPRPVDMVAIFETIDRASTLFVSERYREAIPLLQAILAKDPHNLDAALRLATAHSMLGQPAQALEAFRRAAAIAPKSEDVRLYLALHYTRGPDWAQAAPTLEKIVADTPDRVAAVEGLAVVRERQGRLADAVRLRQRAYALRPAAPAELVRLGELAMASGETMAAIDAFEKARALQRGAFANDLELGVLYLDARRLPEARDALDRVPSSHAGYPMALFKRAQVSVLLNEPDARTRIDVARKHADATTRDLIARERLFQRR
ncbi:MAG TPA: sulfatase-like hydrolase/transferase [Vicinamibacterales bacterium]|nr:sulfatase-like hydrolase/transferase [Vicinamibacterales bacterium]